jgi:hypothetical protein
MGRLLTEIAEHVTEASVVGRHAKRRQTTIVLSARSVWSAKAA